MTSVNCPSNAPSGLVRIRFLSRYQKIAQIYQSIDLKGTLRQIRLMRLPRSWIGADQLLESKAKRSAWHRGGLGQCGLTQLLGNQRGGLRLQVVVVLT